MERWYSPRISPHTLRADKEPTAPASEIEQCLSCQCEIRSSNSSNSSSQLSYFPFMNTLSNVFKNAILSSDKHKNLTLSLQGFEPTSSPNLALERHCYLSWTPPVGKILLNFRVSTLKKNYLHFVIVQI